MSVQDEHQGGWVGWSNQRQVEEVAAEAAVDADGANLITNIPRSDRRGKDPRGERPCEAGHNKGKHGERAEMAGGADG